jgi:SAM-dependent methyltransferase
MNDKSWEKFGTSDPYFAVCTMPQYKSEALDEKSLSEFFNSGQDHASEVLKMLSLKFGLQDQRLFNHIFDFGCGTGRIVIPFAQHAKKVTGVDIAQPMLDEAKKNLAIRNITNVDLIRSSDVNDLHFTDGFDLVHTYIVLQHIPQKKVMTSLTNLSLWFAKMVMVQYTLPSQIASRYLRIRFIRSKTVISGYVNLVLFCKANP